MQEAACVTYLPRLTVCVVVPTTWMAVASPPAIAVFTLAAILTVNRKVSPCLLDEAPFDAPPLACGLPLPCSQPFAEPLPGCAALPAEESPTVLPRSMLQLLKESWMTMMRN